MFYAQVFSFPVLVVCPWSCFLVVLQREIKAVLLQHLSKCFPSSLGLFPEQLAAAGEEFGSGLSGGRAESNADWSWLNWIWKSCAGYIRGTLETWGLRRFLTLYICFTHHQVKSLGYEGTELDVPTKCIDFQTRANQSEERRIMERGPYRERN